VIVPDRLRLPLLFDTPSLATEALALAPGDWVPHFNRDIYEGEWTGAAFRSVGGVATQLYPDPAPTAPFADTELLDRCPAHRRALSQFNCPIMAVRLLALGSSTVLKEHRDYQLGWDDGEIRVHIPIVTAAGVTFVLDGRPVELLAGEAWYLNLNKPHSATNSSQSTRIHLVVDCVVNPWFTDLVERAVAKSSTAQPGGTT
jgi:Aspartyl/Asparaginyl beta-hydroxylase